MTVPKQPKPAIDVPQQAHDGLTQSERFIKAAQELGTDDDPERFATTVRKLAKGGTLDTKKQPTPSEK